MRIKAFGLLIVSSLFISPVNLNAQSPYSLRLNREVVIFGVGLALGIVDRELIKRTEPIKIEELSTLSRENINTFDGAATYNWSPSAADLSDVLLLTSMLSPLLLFTSSTVRDDAGTYTTMYLQNFLWTYSVTHLVKATVTRYRPYVYNDDVPVEMRLIPDSKHSFFSGHTSYAFSFAVFLSTTFANYNPESSLKPYVWGTSLLLATTVGYLRFAAGMHYPTDILTGAIVGSAIGFLIPLIHENKVDGTSPAPPKILSNNLFAISIGF
jgi:membrane-associated phospholipid phosphatase